MKNNKLHLGHKMADGITKIVGSWKFILFQSFLLLIWITLNATAWIYQWDPYPFILLNLVLSFQAAYTAPIILMSQNRAVERDRRKSEMDLSTDKKAEKEIEEIQAKLEQMDKEKLGKIIKLLENKNE